MIKKEGYQIIEGTEGKYDRLVKLTKDFIVEIIFFPRQRSFDIHLSEFTKINQMIMEKATEATIPACDAPRDIPKQKPKRYTPKFPDVFKDRLELDFAEFYVNLTNKLNQSLVFECYTRGSEIFIRHVQVVPKEGLKYVNSPIISRQKDKYKGPLFYHLSTDLQEKFLKVLHENCVVQDVGYWISCLSLYSEQKKYIEWLSKMQFNIAK